MYYILNVKLLQYFCRENIVYALWAKKIVWRADPAVYPALLCTCETCFGVFLNGPWGKYFENGIVFLHEFSVYLTFCTPPIKSIVIFITYVLWSRFNHPSAKCHAKSYIKVFSFFSLIKKLNLWKVILTHKVVSSPGLKPYWMNEGDGLGYHLQQSVFFWTSILQLLENGKISHSLTLPKL